MLLVAHMAPHLATAAIQIARFVSQMARLIVLVANGEHLIGVLVANPVQQTVRCAQGPALINALYVK